MLNAVAAALSGGTQPALPGFLNSLAGPLGHYGVWAIALLVLLEDFGIPVPGETVLIAGAVYAGSGRLNIVMVGVVGFVAAVVGDNIGYAIGRFGGRRVVDRYGKYVFLTSERLDKAERFFDRQGGKIITIARFIEGLRQANGIIAGIIEMHWLKFVAFNALGAALWVGTWVSLGYFAGQHIETIYNDITKYSLYAAVALVVLIAAWIAFRLRKRHLTKAAEATAEQDGTAEQAGTAERGAQDEQGEPAVQGGSGATGQPADATSASEAAGAAGPHGTGGASEAASGTTGSAGPNGVLEPTVETGQDLRNHESNGMPGEAGDGVRGPAGGTRPARPAGARRPGPTNGTRPA